MRTVRGARPAAQPEGWRWLLILLTLLASLGHLTRRPQVGGLGLPGAFLSGPQHGSERRVEGERELARRPSTQEVAQMPTGQTATRHLHEGAGSSIRLSDAAPNAPPGHHGGFSGVHCPFCFTAGFALEPQPGPAPLLHPVGVLLEVSVYTAVALAVVRHADPRAPPHLPRWTEPQRPGGTLSPSPVSAGERSQFPIKRWSGRFLFQSMPADGPAWRFFMLKIRPSVLALSMTLLLPVAAAHATVRTEGGLAESKVGATETYRLNVPTEKEISTTQIRLVIPPGVAISRFQTTPGFTRTVTRNADGLVTGVVWKGRIAPLEYARFFFQARNPATAGELTWKVYQTYSDGSVVAWDDTDPEQGPASKVAVK